MPIRNLKMRVCPCPNPIAHDNGLLDVCNNNDNKKPTVFFLHAQNNHKIIVVSHAVTHHGRIMCECVAADKSHQNHICACITCWPTTATRRTRHIALLTPLSGPGPILLHTHTHCSIIVGHTLRRAPQPLTAHHRNASVLTRRRSLRAALLTRVSKKCCVFQRFNRTECVHM